MASDLRFKDKVAIVTGGCSGIGKGCAEILVESGGNVVIFDINDEIGNSLNMRGPGKAKYVHCDVCNEKEIQESIQKVVDEFGRIDCLVNNVGTNAGSHVIDELSVDGFKKLLDINVVSMFAMSKYTLPHLRKYKGSIVNISSFSGTNGQGLVSTYCSTKGAIRSFSKALSIDESKHGVRVNSICPGPINTPAMDAFVKGDQKVRDFIGSWSLLGRLGQSREIGLACLFLATDATFTTGADLMCTGGCEVVYGVKAEV